MSADLDQILFRGWQVRVNSRGRVQLERNGIPLPGGELSHEEALDLKVALRRLEKAN